MPISKWMDKKDYGTSMHGILLDNKKEQTIGNTQRTWVNLEILMWVEKNQSQKLHMVWSCLYANHEMTSRDVIDTCPPGLLLLEHLLLELIHHSLKPGPHEAATWKITETLHSTDPVELLANNQHQFPSWIFQPSRTPGRLQPNHHHRWRRTSPLIPGKSPNCER